MNSQRTDMAKAVMTACIVSLATIAPAAVAQITSLTGGNNNAAPATTAKSAGSAGMSIGMLAAIGAGVIAAPPLPSPSRGLAGPASSAGSAANQPPKPPVSAPGQQGMLNSKGGTATSGPLNCGAAGPGGALAGSASAGTGTQFDPAASPVNTGNAAGPIVAADPNPKGMNGPASSAGQHVPNAQNTPPTSDQATFNALLSAGAIRRDKSGGYTISPTITPAQLATLITLSWNAIQAAGIDPGQLLAALAKEQTLDQHPSQDKPTKELTLSELQHQLAEDLKLQLPSEKKKRLDKEMKEFNDEMQQYIKNALANDVRLQKQLDTASGNGSGGFPYIAAGFVTPQSSYPTNLTATYNGGISGALNDATPVSGTLSMTVNFANLSSIPGSINFANGQGTANFALTGNGGAIGGQMSGTFAGEAIGLGSNLSGKFYGPAANEVGGAWSLHTQSHDGNGQFAAKR